MHTHRIDLLQRHVPNTLLYAVVLIHVAMATRTAMDQQERGRERENKLQQSITTVPEKEHIVIISLQSATAGHGSVSGSI
jgi:hypothetical protein